MPPADVDARMARVVEELHREVVTCCPHVLTGASVPVICALHPAAGLTCVECAQVHLERSTEHARPCDACQAERIAEAIPAQLTIGTPPAPDALYVRTPTGDEALVAGVVVIWGLVGLCKSCHAAWPSNAA